MKNIFAALLLMIMLVTFSSACTPFAPTNLPGISWKYCDIPSMIIIQNDSNTDVFVRFRVTSTNGTKDFEATVTSGHSMSRQSIGPVTKVLITDWVKYNKH